MSSFLEQAYPAKLGEPGAMQPMLENRWFRGLSADAQARLLARCTMQQLSDGQAVYRQGGQVRATDGGFFALLEGSLSVSSYTLRGDEAIVSLINPGSWFGELALLESAERARTVVCAGDCRLLAVSSSDFHDLLAQDAQFAIAVAALAASRARLLLALLEDATSRSAKSRIARRLVLLAHGDDVRNGRTRDQLHISHDSLGSMLGLSRQAISRNLQDLHACGAVLQQYGQLRITSMVALLSAAACP